MYLQKARDNMLIYILSQSLSHIFSLYGLGCVAAKASFAQSSLSPMFCIFISVIILALEHKVEK